MVCESITQKSTHYQHLSNEERLYIQYELRTGKIQK